MAYMVVPGEHDREPPMEIHADANASRAITAVTIRFPPQFQRVLVVSYRPSQIWVEPTGPGPRIAF